MDAGEAGEADLVLPLLSEPAAERGLRPSCWSSRWIVLDVEAGGDAAKPYVGMVELLDVRLRVGR